MAVRRRRRPASGEGKLSSFLSLFRGLLILVCLAAGSFALGFFVISRLLPAGGRSETVSGMAARRADAPDSGTTDPGKLHRAASLRPPQRENASRLNTPSAAAPGPSVEPIEETSVQQPVALDASNDRDRSTGPSSADPFHTPDADSQRTGADQEHARRRGRRRSRRSSEAQPESADPSTPSNSSRPSDSSAPPAPRGSRERGRGGETSPETPDAGVEPAPRTRGLYPVQLGIYSTREAAEQQVRQARDRGFEVSVIPVTRDGRSQYRVQHGVYRSRDNALAEKRRLEEAGIPAYVP